MGFSMLVVPLWCAEPVDSMLFTSTHYNLARIVCITVTELLEVAQVGWNSDVTLHGLLKSLLVPSLN